MLDVLLQLLATTQPPQTPPVEIENEWGGEDAIIYILLGVGLILTVAVAAIFFFILARGDRED